VGAVGITRSNAGPDARNGNGWPNDFSDTRDGRDAECSRNAVALQRSESLTGPVIVVTTIAVQALARYRYLASSIVVRAFRVILRPLCRIV
jgi:hypothetical protein